MKKKSASQSAFFNLRVLIGLFIVLAGVFLALVGFGAFSRHCDTHKRSRITLEVTVSDPSSSLRDLTVPKFARWASTSKKTCGPELS